MKFTQLLTERQQKEFFDTVAVNEFALGDEIWRSRSVRGHTALLTDGVVAVRHREFEASSDHLIWFWSMDCPLFCSDDSKIDWYISTVVVSEKAKIAFVDRDWFLSLALVNPNILNFQVESQTAYFKNLVAAWFCLTPLLADERVLYLFSGLIYRFGFLNRENLLVLPIRVMRVLIAGATRSRLETIVRILTRWRKQGWTIEDRTKIVFRGELAKRLNELNMERFGRRKFVPIAMQPPK